MGQPDLTRSILNRAFELLEYTEGEVLRDLPYTWDETDDWKDSVFREVTTPSGESKMIDDRLERVETPQYQSATDAEAAAQSHDGQSCLVCVGIDI